MPESTAAFGGHSHGSPALSAWVEDVETWAAGNVDLLDPSHAHRLYWPDRPYLPGLEILVAGCGPSQAAAIAYNNPQALVTAIDIDEPALNHETYLRHKHKLLNLDVHPLQPVAIADVVTLNREFDLVIASNVLDQMGSAKVAMKALSEVLRPDGVVAVMVAAQGGSVERNAPAGFSVADCLDLVEGSGLVFQEWLHKSSYYPPGLVAVDDEVLAAIEALPERRRWSLMDTLRGPGKRHMFTACRADRPVENYRIDFGSTESADYVPMWRPNAGLADSVLFRHERSIPVSGLYLDLAQRIDGEHSVRQIGDLAQSTAGEAIGFFKHLWQMDFIAVGLGGATA